VWFVFAYALVTKPGPKEFAGDSSNFGAQRQVRVIRLALPPAAAELVEMTCSFSSQAGA
jgi:hypothetical protein